MLKRRLPLKVAGQYRNRVRECRLRAMVTTQEELSQMTGIARSTVSALEKNRLFLSSHYALLIAEALGCSLDELYEKRRARGKAGIAAGLGEPRIQSQEVSAS